MLFKHFLTGLGAFSPPLGLAFFVVAILAPLILPAGPAGAAELRLLGVSPAGAPPAPDYPVPNDPGQVFYLQRSANPNTVVYAARFKENGALDAKDPISGYWRRFNTSGEARDLSILERRFVYGVEAKERTGGSFEIDFRAIPELDVVLEQRGPGQAVLTVAPQGEPIDLAYGYVHLEQGGITPKVTGLTLFGRLGIDGRPVQIEYGVNGKTGGERPGASGALSPDCGKLTGGAASLECPAAARMAER